MTPAAYRQKVLDDINARRLNRKSHPLDELLARELPSLESAGPPDPAATADALQRISQTEAHGTNLRAAALHRMGASGQDSDSSIDATLTILENTAESPDLRKSAINALKQLLFVNPQIEDHRGRYLQALRSAADSADESLRTAALELLVRRRDPATQARLLQTVRDGGPYLTTLAKTVQLLGYDIHTEVYEHLRALLEKAPAEDVAYEAVRVLSADPASVEVLAKVFRDKTHGDQVRAASGIALQSLHPELFEKHAKELAIDPKEASGLRSTTLHCLQRFANPASLRSDSNFQNKLGQILEGKLESTLEHAVRKVRDGK